jgi:hypothetical protein
MAQGKAARDLKKEAGWRRHMKAQVGSDNQKSRTCMSFSGRRIPRQ